MVINNNLLQLRYRKWIDSTVYLVIAVKKNNQHPRCTNFDLIIERFFKDSTLYMPLYFKGLEYRECSERGDSGGDGGGLPLCSAHYIDIDNLFKKFMQKRMH